MIYALGFALALLILLFLKVMPNNKVLWARDPGPLPGEHYPFWDRWSWWHLGAGFLLVGVPVWTGIAAWWVALVGFWIIAEGWEYVEGHREWNDIITGLAGGLLALGMKLWS
jgi:hypothetical protein